GKPWAKANVHHDECLSLCGWITGRGHLGGRHTKGPCLCSYTHTGAPPQGSRQKNTNHSSSRCAAYAGDGTSPHPRVPCTDLLYRALYRSTANPKGRIIDSGSQRLLY